MSDKDKSQKSPNKLAKEVKETADYLWREETRQEDRQIIMESWVQLRVAEIKNKRC